MRDEHVTIISRHSAKCPDRSKGEKFLDCSCKKSLRVWSPEEQLQFRVPTRERSKSEAEKYRRQYLNRHDPEHARDLARLDQYDADEATKGGPKRIPIDDAVVAYINNLRKDKKAHGTIKGMESFWGYADPISTKVLRHGKFLKWIHGMAFVQPKYLDEITPEMLDSFIATWTVGDTTENRMRVQLKSFFKFCTLDRDWLEKNPARRIKLIKVRRGNRTTAFTPEQVAAIFAAVDEYHPASERERLRAYVHLLRYSGMDLIDATQFKPSNLVGRILTYRRQKTGEMTWAIELPVHVADMLRALPGPMPFRTASFSITCDCRNWRLRLKRLFKLAGIASVTTDVREDRAPHAKMMRDTFASESLNAGIDIRNVQHMLGHMNLATTARYYLPHTEADKAAHLAMLRKAAGAA
jgi:site-specific recombinase XerD